MRKLFLTLIGACIILYSCQTPVKEKKAAKQVTPKPKTEVKKDIPAESEAKLIKGSYSIVAGKGADTSTSYISYVFYEDKGNLSVWQQSINNFIKKSLYRAEGSPISKDPLTVKMIEKSMNDFKRYANRHKYEYEMTYSTTDIYAIDDQHKEFATLIEVSSSYEGGAHGMHGTGNYQFDKRTGKELTLKDFVSDMKEFNRIAESYFRKSRGIPANIKLSSKDHSFDFWFENDQFACNDNFCFDGKSMHFMYMPYEITNYAEGTIEFSIPMKKIEHLLKLH
jgi:rubrerythrin